MSAIAALQVLFQAPPIPYEAQKHTLKMWAKYCLQIQGYRVVYTDKADFAVELGDRTKLYCNVTTHSTDLDPTATWIIWNTDTQSATIQPASSSSASI
jgi:hypothetical protein